MNESDFRRSYQKWWESKGGAMWRIPDSPPVQGRSPGTRPFDLVGIRNGKFYAVEVKLMKGGITFNSGRLLRPHQEVELKRVHSHGGRGLVVLGWIPTGTNRSVTFEWEIQNLGEKEPLSLTHPNRVR